MFTFIGILNGIDKYNRIRIVACNPTIITKEINDINNPYKFIDGKLECLVVPTKHKDYYLSEAETNKNKIVSVTVNPRKYSFNGKKGTSLLLKSFVYIDIA